MLWRACNLTAFMHSLTAPAGHPFASHHEGPGFNPQGYLCETEILLLALSRYIGDADVIDYCGLVWGGVHPEPPLGRHADNVIITWSHTALRSRFHAHCRSFFRLHSWHSRLLGERPAESLQSHWIHTQFHWSSGPPICFPSWGTGGSIPRGYLCETRIILLAFSRYSVNIEGFSCHQFKVESAKKIVVFLLHLEPLSLPLETRQGNRFNR
jgi:hypothetical protein